MVSKFLDMTKIYEFILKAPVRSFFYEKNRWHGKHD